MRIVIFILAIFPKLLSAQGFLSATLDSNIIITGDPTGLNILAKIPENSSKIQLDITGILQSEKFEILEEPIQKNFPSEGYTMLEWKYILTSFDTGYHILPAVKLLYENQGESFEIHSQNLGLEVNFLPIGQDEAFLQPIKEIIKEPFLLSDAIPFIIGGLAISMILLGLFWIWRKRKNNVQPASNIIQSYSVNPFDYAISQLSALENSIFLQNKMWKEFHFELSHIFREYIEMEFKYPALESTLEEVKSILLKINPKENNLTSIEEILNKAELIKFAKLEVSEEFHLKALNDIRSFILIIKPINSEDLEKENSKSND